MVRIGAGGSYHRSTAERLSSPNRSKVNVKYQVKEGWAAEEEPKAQQQAGGKLDRPLSNWENDPGRRGSNVRAFHTRGVQTLSPESRQRALRSSAGIQRDVDPVFGGDAAAVDRTPRDFNWQETLRTRTTISRGRLRPARIQPQLSRGRGRPSSATKAAKAAKPLASPKKRKDCGVKSRRSHNRERLAFKQRQQRAYLERSQRRAERRRVQREIRQEEYYLHQEELQQHLHEELCAVDGDERPKWTIANDKPLSRVSSRGLWAVEDVTLDYHADKKRAEELREKRDRELRSIQGKGTGKPRRTRPASAPLGRSQSSPSKPIWRPEGKVILETEGEIAQEMLMRLQQAPEKHDGHVFAGGSGSGRPASAQLPRRRLQPRSEQHVRVRPASAHASPAAAASS